MTCYQIIQGSEPVALVATMALARRIIQCQPPGFYEVDTVEVGEPIASRRARARGSSIKSKVRRGRARAVKPPGPGIPGGVKGLVDRARNHPR